MRQAPERKLDEDNRHAWNCTLFLKL